MKGYIPVFFSLKTKFKYSCQTDIHNIDCILSLLEFVYCQSKCSNTWESEDQFL